MFANTPGFPDPSNPLVPRNLGLPFLHLEHHLLFPPLLRFLFHLRMSTDPDDVLDLPLLRGLLRLDLMLLLFQPPDPVL